MKLLRIAGKTTLWVLAIIGGALVGLIATSEFVSRRQRRSLQRSSAAWTVEESQRQMRLNAADQTHSL